MTADPVAPLGARVMRSSLWMLMNSAITRLITFLAQIALSVLLTKSDFGIYAAAMSISAFLTNLRGAGMGQWLTQGGRERLEGRAGHAFWTSLAFNIGLGLLIVALAIPAATFFGDERVRLVLFISGASFPLITVGSYFKQVMAIELRMREITTIEIISAVLRYGLIVMLAATGFGPLSFVIPLPISFALEGILGYLYTRDKAWRRRSSPREWLPLILGNRWILVGTFVTTVALQGDYFVLGKLATLTTLGTYYFAYQMTYMSAGLITENARRVLFPGLVAVPADRRPAAALRAATICTVLGAPLLLMLGAAIGPLENFIWHGKWADAVAPIQLFSLGLPLQLMTTVTQSSLQSDGRFRLWSMVNGIRGCCVVVGAMIGGTLYAGNIHMIATIMTVSFAVANATQVWIAYRVQEIRLSAVLRACFASVVIAPLSLCATIGMTRVVDVDPIWELALGLAVFGVLWIALTAVFDGTALRMGAAALHSALRPGTKARLNRGAAS